METLLSAVGRTPLLKLSRGLPAHGASVYAKLERFNPSVSIKDRHAKAMIEAAETSGALEPGGTVLEAVAGNTGIALAHICNIRGYQLVLTMPEDYMPERRHVLSCLGIRIETTPAEDGIQGAMRRAEEIQAAHPEYYVPDHFHNAAQLEAHRQGLIAEIQEDLQGIPIHAVVGCVGTGSTLAALAETFKPQGAQIILIQPEADNVIPGIAFGTKPPYLRADMIDRVERMTNQEAVQGFRELARESGVLAGLSSGANYRVAKKISAELGKGRNILTLFYDGGERYFSLEKGLKLDTVEGKEEGL